jgi:hypothetical protein
MHATSLMVPSHGGFTAFPHVNLIPCKIACVQLMDDKITVIFPKGRITLN